MHLVYDHQIFSLQQYGGVSRYFVELAEAITVDPDFDVGVVAPLYLNGFLRASTKLKVHGLYVPHVRGTGNMRFRANSAATRAFFLGRRPSVVHETYFALDRLAPRSVPTVLTVFDMIHERFAESFPPRDDTRLRKRAAVSRVSHVICISESTRNDLLQEIDVDPSKVSVVPLAADPALAGLASPVRIVANEYVLYVGHRDGYKNFATCAAAFAESGLVERGVNLVCFGGGRWTAADARALNTAGLSSESVVHLSGGDGMLASLYKHAELFIYPSMYEGFGIPPLEAMVCGCPVACSDTSSLPEVVGAAAETFNPCDTGAIASAILRVVESPGRSAELRRLGTRRVEEFSWQRCADQTKAIYRSLV